MIALEPRMLFDGALGIDVGARERPCCAATQPSTPAAPRRRRPLLSPAPEARRSRPRAGGQAAAAPFEACRAGRRSRRSSVRDNERQGYQDPLKNIIRIESRLLVRRATGITRREGWPIIECKRYYLIAQGSAGPWTWEEARSTRTRAGSQREAHCSNQRALPATLRLIHVRIGKGDPARSGHRRRCCGADVADVDVDGRREGRGRRRKGNEFVDPGVRRTVSTASQSECQGSADRCSSATASSSADVIKQYQRVDAIHVIRGSEGARSTSRERANGITMTVICRAARRNASRSGDADLLVYGCNFGRAPRADGRKLLAQMTGAEVAARH